MAWCDPEFAAFGMPFCESLAKGHINNGCENTQCTMSECGERATDDDDDDEDDVKCKSTYLHEFIDIAFRRRAASHHTDVL